MLKISEDLANSSSYHLFKAGEEDEIIPTDLNDYVFLNARIMPFRDIIAQVLRENPSLLPKNQFMNEIEDAWKLYKELRKEINGNGWSCFQFWFRGRETGFYFW